MQSLTIQLFGPFRVYRGDSPLPRTRTRAEYWLLALLVLRHEQETEREWLAATLWPDSSDSQALNNLRRSLSLLRKALGPDAWRLCAPTPHTLRFDLAGAECDLVAFDTAIARGDEAFLEQAVELYRGPLLETCYEEWVTPERERREQAYLDALETLAGLAKNRQKPADAVRWLRQIVALDPLRETTQRAMMEALAALGDHAGMTQAYRSFRLLLHEANTQPDAETVALYRLLRAEARENAHILPRLPTSSASPLRRLPTPQTPLIGREREIGEIIAHLETTRLLTLIGTGGVGKTRLALAAAEEIAEEYREGVCFVDLALLSDPARVVQATASALEVREEPNSPLLETLLDTLQAQSLLLVLDNCEHLVQACAVLAEALLARCPHLRLFATSRQPLGVLGERTWRVPSLSLPEASVQEWEQEKEAQAVLMASEAVQLFVERAASVQPDFRLTRANLHSVAELCRLLDGIPLALEFAAAWVRVMPVSQTLSRLRGRLDLLQSQQPQRLQRHQTLGATLDWSYGLLAEEERRLLRRLSVFAGGWTLEAAEAVCGEDGESPDAVLLRLAKLVDKSLVLYSEQAEGEGRYRLLETTRQYAREKLRESGEETTVGARHRDYFLDQLESGSALKTNCYDYNAVWWRHRSDYNRWCKDEIDNCREALRFSLEEPDGGKAALRLGVNLFAFWIRGASQEGVDSLDAALQKEDGSGMRERIAALYCATVLAENRSDRNAAQRYAQERVALARRDGNHVLLAHALNELVKNRIYADHTAEALPLLEEALSLAMRSQDRHITIYTKASIAQLKRRLGELEEALRLFEEVLVYVREVRNPGWTCTTRLDIAGILCLLGDSASASVHYREVLQAYLHGNDWREVTDVLEEMALTLYAAHPAPTKRLTEWAARLAGSAEKQRTVRQFPPSGRLYHDSLGRLRAALEEEIFATAWAEGAAMTLEEAVAYALQEQSDPSA